MDAALAEVRSIDARTIEHEKSQQILGQLDAMARGDAPTLLHGLAGDSQRLSFGKQMATAAAGKIMPPSSYGQKAVAPSGSVVVPQQFISDPIALGQPATSLLSVLPVTVQPSQNFAYLRQSVRTNLAAVVAEGAVKPTSVYSVIRVEDSLDVIAHLSEAVPRLWFVDVPALQAFLSNELTYGLGLAVEAKVLADIVGTSGIQTNAYSTSVLATLRKSVTKLEMQGYAPGTIVLHPTDFESIELALLSTPAIEYNSLPFDAVARRLWGFR